MNKKRAIDIVNKNTSFVRARCMDLVERGEYEAAARCSADARHHTVAFSGWYMPKKRRVKR